MSAGMIFTVLSNIPWGQVIENAPKVADAARRLWSNASRRNAETAEELSQETEPSAAGPEQLKREVAALQERVQALQNEMQLSSQLIKDLAEQNTALVQRIELNRLKMVRLAVATAGGFALLLAVGVFLLLSE